MKKTAQSEEKRQAMLARMAHARECNRKNNPLLKSDQSVAEIEIDAEGQNSGLKPHLEEYLNGPKSKRDFDKLRKKSPKDALVIAMERVWGDKSATNKASNKGLFALIQVLSGQKNTPQHIVPHRDIPSEHNDTPKPEIIDISLTNHNDE